MFSKFSVVVASAFVVLAAASPKYYGTTYPGDSCGAMSTAGVPPPPPVSVSSAATVTPTSILSVSTDIPPVDSVSSAVTTVTGAAAPPSSTGAVGSGSGSSNQCCTSVQWSNTNAVSAIAGLLGLDLSGLNVPIGLGCSPITVLGNNCGGTQVSCNSPEKEWGSLIAINCVQLVL